MSTETQVQGATWRYQAAIMLLGVCSAALFYLVATLHGEEGHAAVPNLMALEPLAQAMCLDDSGSAQPVSHITLPRLYPAVIGLLRKAGLRDMALVEGLYAINIAFFTLFGLFVFMTARQIHPTAGGGVALLLLLNGYIVSSAMDLTDAGLYMTLMAGLLFSVSSSRPWIATAFMTLIAWCRAESILVAIGMLCGWVGNRREFGAWRWLVTGLVGFVISLYFMTASSFMPPAPSLSTKLLRQTLPPLLQPGSYARAMVLLGRLMHEVLFGLTLDKIGFLMPALAGGLLALLGLCSVEWRTERPNPLLGGIILAMLASLAWATFSAPEEFSWEWLPSWPLAIWIAAAALGARRLAEFLPARRYVYPSLMVLLISYQLWGFPCFLRTYGAGCASTQSLVRFLKEQHQALPPSASLGLISHPGLRYFLPDRSVRLAFGPANPQLVNPRHMAGAVEIYKYHRELRPDFWLVHSKELGNPLIAPMLGKAVAALGDPADSGNGGWILYRADDACCSPAPPTDPDIQEALKSLRLISRLDVGYLPDETRHEYRIHWRLPSIKIPPPIVLGGTDDSCWIDTGQLILGSDEFSLSILPRRPLRIVLRTTAKAEADVTQWDAVYPGERFHFRSPLRILPIVNGRPMQQPLEVNLRPVPDAINEVVLDIPADYLDTDRTHIRLVGDRIAFAYWFYQ